jgi:hypothetical protein
MEAVGRAAVGGAAGTGAPDRGLAVTVRVALEGGTAALVVAMAAVAGVMGRVAVAVGGMSLELAGLLSGSSPS